MGNNKYNQNGRENPVYRIRRRDYYLLNDRLSGMTDAVCYGFLRKNSINC